MIHEFKKVIPVVINETKEEGYILYMKDNGMFENDEFAIVICNGGKLLHFRSDQFTIHNNATYDFKNHKK